jgi:hypothetical protein
MYNSTCQSKHGREQKRISNQNFAHYPIILRFHVDDCLVRFLYDGGKVIVIGVISTHGHEFARDIQSQVTRHPR